MIPWAWRSPVGRRVLAHGRASVPAGRGRQTRARLAERVEAARPGTPPGHRSRPTRSAAPRPSRPRRRCEPLAVGMRLAVAGHVRDEARDATTDGSIGRPGVDEPGVGPPQGREAGHQALRGRALAIEPKRRQPLEPLADAGRLDRRGGQGRCQLDDVEAGSTSRDRLAPAHRAIGQQPDRSNEIGCAAVRIAHRADGTTGRQGRYGRAADRTHRRAMLG